MVVSVEALGFEEDPSRVEVSIADLITTEEVGDMAGSSKTWDFGPLLMMKDMIEELRQLGCFSEAKVKPPQGEMIPKPQAVDAMVFKEFFLCGLCFLASYFLH